MSAAPVTDYLQFQDIAGTMTPPAKLTLYLLLAGAALLGLALEQSSDSSHGIWVFGIAIVSIPFLITLLEWIVPWLSGSPKRATVCSAALKRLRKDEALFQHLAEAQQSGEELEGIHLRLVEADSYKWTQRDIMPLLTYWKYWSTAKAILSEIKQNRYRQLEDMDVGRLRELLAKLEGMLKREIGEA